MRKSSRCMFRIGPVCLLLCFCGCSQKYYSVFVENQSNQELKAVEISFVGSDFHFDHGGLVHGIHKGYGPCNPNEIPEKVKLTWEQSGREFEKEVAVPESIREKIEGNGEDLFFRIGEDEKVDVYVKISNPRNLANPTYFPEKFGKKRK